MTNFFDWNCSIFSGRLHDIDQIHKGQIMDCLAIEAREGAPSLFKRLLGLARAIRMEVRRYPLLDPDCLPDHIKRDLGFADGRRPRYEDDMPR
jgi:hypothetical protein